MHLWLWAVGIVVKERQANMGVVAMHYGRTM